MSGISFDNPAVRFTRRLSFYQIRMRYVVALLCGWLTGANRQLFRINFRRYVAEFPKATQTAYQLLVGTLRGSRARDRASTDALRPKYNWVKPEDQHDISIIWEKWPAFAWRLPQKGRQSPAPSKRAVEGAGEKISLAENNLALFWRKTEDDGRAKTAIGGTKWFRAFALVVPEARIS